MNIIETLAPPGPFLEPFNYAVVLYGLRYLVMSSVAFLIARPVARAAGGGLMSMLRRHSIPCAISAANWCFRYSPFSYSGWSTARCSVGICWMPA